jgi:hypothetical protein
MSLLTLTAPDGSTFAVNPHRVSAVQPYFSPTPDGGRRETSVVWVDARNVHICDLTTEEAIAAITEARKTDHHAFVAGYVAAFVAKDEAGGAHMNQAWGEYVESGGDTTLPWRKAAATA